MRFFRRRRRPRFLSEEECYTRLHGQRSDQVRLQPAVRPDAREPGDGGNGRDEPAPPPRSSGPDRAEPALHLVIPFPRGGVTMSGEELRRALLRKMERRAGRRSG